jgi:DNA replicative helicase MCM subunit Mcm2 (Cdc46/Mcm family)
MEKLLRISIVLSLMGLMILLILAQSLRPLHLEINKISSEDLNKKISFDANILKVKELAPQYLLIYLENNNSTIEGTLNSKNFTFNSTSNYKIIGKIQEYNNSLQINIDKIQKND